MTSFKYIHLLPLSLAACTLNLPDLEGTTSTTTTTTTTTDGLSETGIVTAADTGSATSTSTSLPTSTAADPSGTGMGSEPGTGVTSGSGFILAPDGGSHPDFCDPFAQDCPPDQKCTWWNLGEGTDWKGTKCVDVARDPALVGEPCVAPNGGFAGDDDCERGAMCFEVDDNGDGECIALCGGNEQEPTCPADSACVVSSSALALCIETCDPIAQDCEPGDACIPHHTDEYFCIIDASGDLGQLHDPCEFSNTCDPGFVCAGSPSASECDQKVTGCCQPYCDLDMPDTCTGVGQTCLPVFDPQPAGFENVGICGIKP